MGSPAYIQTRLACGLAPMTQMRCPVAMSQFISPRGWILLSMTLLAGCAVGPKDGAGSGIDWVSEPRALPVRYIVLHHTAADTPTSLKVLSGRDPLRRVSAHYLITDETAVRTLPLVPESRVAYHAGESHWLGAEGLNGFTLGVELVNRDGNRHAYSDAQLEALAALLKELIARHGLGPDCLLAHSDISPGRKIDPGALFPWERLYREHGLGDWPDANAVRALMGGQPPSERQLAALLRLRGYKADGADPASLRDAVSAFQRRYRPAKADGVADAETVARLRALLAPRR